MPRPEILFPIFAETETLPGIGPKLAKTLDLMGIATIRDLILTLPINGVDRRRVPSLRDLTLPAIATVLVKIKAHSPPSRKGLPYRVYVQDDGLEFTLVFFRGQKAWFEKSLPIGETRLISGKAELFDGQAQITHPDYILAPDEAGELPEFEPIYPLSAGLSAKVMARAADAAVKRAPQLAEWIDPALKAQKSWPDWADAVALAHAPQSLADLSPDHPARLRLAYDELFAHQLTLAIARQRQRRALGRVNAATGRLTEQVLQTLPYELTQAQQRCIAEIHADMAQKRRMSRLLQGDVGAGKTIVALMAMLAAVEAGGQAAMMAPTEILARQHFSALSPMVAALGISMDILTGRDSGQQRQDKLLALADGSLDVLIGTHALFQPDVQFHDLRLAVIDEQHRFGVAQRLELGAKGQGVDVLVMTATPIPRSLALSNYGDLDLSILDEKPPGRTPVKTALVSAKRIDEVIQHLKAAIEAGKQAYWVCPLVDQSETLDLSAAETRMKKLSGALGAENVGLVHGQMPPARKDAVMAQFHAGELKVLVATTVIEVGVDVPNASIMVIESAENFGLAQLHQLRGRVGRGAAQSTCVLLHATQMSETAEKRLSLMRETEDGFRIAEEDLAMRGAGDVLGRAQSGVPRFRVANLERQAGLMATAQNDARAVLEQDPELATARGEAIRCLLWFMEQNKAISLLQVG